MFWFGVFLPEVGLHLKCILRFLGENCYNTQISQRSINYPCFPSVSFCTSQWCTLSRVSGILLSSINIDAVFLGLTPGGE